MKIFCVRHCTGTAQQLSFECVRRSSGQRFVKEIAPRLVFDEVVSMGRQEAAFLEVAAFLEMITKSVNLRATAATRTGCVRHGMGAAALKTPEARKISGIGFHLPGVYTPRRVGSQILVLRLPQFLHAPTQNSKDVEKSTSSCDP